MSFATPAKSKSGKYLFCYFVGNEPQEERIHFAVSEDGYNFTALNNNEPVIIQTKGKKCVRDPYIFKGQDDFYYIIGTDMKCQEGWTSNHALVTWKSKDLVNWTDETIIDMRDFGGEFATTTRAWAPQAIWDEKAIYSKGLKDGKKEVVKKMLEENASIDFILKVTGLTREQLEKIKTDMN